MDPIVLPRGMLPLLGGALIGGGAVAATGLLWRARPHRGQHARELERLVWGRQSVRDALARYGPLDFAALRDRLRPSPGPERLADWLGSMVADGSLHATLDREGRAVFIESTEPLPRVTIDTARARRRVDRRAELYLEEPPGAGSGEGL
ncbi:MAG TPA: hypothetical protein VMV28_02180 [Thermoplasmata archaeon]|nr:hypothetical protein [Thermoplasmata archaeon]